MSEPIYYTKNINYSIELLLDNGYPLHLIFKYINLRIKKIFTTKLNKCNGTENFLTNKTQKRYIGLPYMKGFTKILNKTLKQTDYLPGYKCYNKLNTFIKLHKDPTEHTLKNNIIYKIHCNECDASYVGQTKRKLNTRINEHKRNIKQPKLNVVSQHIMDSNHSMNWSNVQILDHETNYYKRLISETIHIKQQKNGLNINEDTDLLDKTYFPLLEKLNNQHRSPCNQSV